MGRKQEKGARFQRWRMADDRWQIEPYQHTPGPTHRQQNHKTKVNDINALPEVVWFSVLHTLQSQVQVNTGNRNKAICQKSPES